MKKTILFLFMFILFVSTAFSVDWTVTLIDTYGDGWNGGALDVSVNGTTVLSGLTISSGGGPENHTLTVAGGDEITTSYSAGSWSTENEYYIYDQNSNLVASEGTGGATPGSITTPIVVPSASAPAAVSNPSPIDGAISVAVLPTITWDFGANTETYDLYFDTVNPPVAQVVTDGAAGATGSYTPSSDLSTNTTYYWYVLSKNSVARLTTDGSVYSFTTVLGANIVEIGAETVTNQSLPVEPYYGYSYSQSIYLQSEIDRSGERIEKIWYHYNGGSDLSATTDWVVYMGHTSATELTDWIPLANLTQVASITLDPVPDSDMWIELPLALPFVYNNIDNLVIAIEDNASGYDTSSDEFFCSTVTGNRSYEYHNDSNNPDPASPPAGNAKAYIPNIRMEFGAVPTTPVFSINPESWDFGTQLNGTTTSKTFTITNVGGADLVISSIAMQTGTDFGIVDANSYPLTLGIGISATFDVNFIPTVGGALSDNVVIVDNTTRATQTVAVTGTGDATLPDPTTLVAPTDAAGDQPDSGTLEWNAANLASGYDLYLGTDNPPTNVLNGVDQGDVLTYSYSGLTAGATYYWQVVSYNYNGDATASSVWSFSIVGNAPRPVTLVSPADEATETEVDLTLEWNSSTGAAGYYLYFGTDNPPTNVENGTDNGTDLTYSATGLANGTTYYWQVVPYNGVGPAAGCPVWSFTTYANTVTSFPYTYSFDTATLHPAWTIDPIVSGDSWEIGNTELGGHGATAEHTGNGGYMAVIDDSTPETVPAHLYSPDFDMSTLTNPILNFWYWIGDNSNTSELHIDVITGTGTDASVAVLTDASGSLGWQEANVALNTYAGQTISIDFRAMESSSYEGDISVDDIRIFDNVNPPAATTLVSPADAATDVALTGNLEWTFVSLADGYYLNFGTDNPPTNIMSNADQGITNTYAYSGLNTGTTYYWQIVPFNANGNATGNAVWSFTTTSSVPDPATNPEPADGYVEAPVNGTLIWDASTLADGYYLNFGTDNPPTNVLNMHDNSTDLSYTYSGLSYLTTYYWQVVPHNAAGNAVNCPVWSITTQADPRIQPPYLQTFDWSTSVPDKWDTNMSVRTSWGIAGSNTLYKNLWSSTPTCYAELENVTNIDANDYVYYYYRIVDYSGAPNNATTLGSGDQIVLAASTDDGNTYTPIYTVDETTHTTSTGWAKVEVPLAAFVGNDVKFRFDCARGTGDWYILIDNFFVGPVESNVIISEVNTGTTQYVELYNAGTITQSLLGWTLHQVSPLESVQFAVGLDTNMGSSYLLYPGDYVTIFNTTYADFMLAYPSFIGDYVASTDVPQIVNGSWIYLDDGISKSIVDQFGSATSGATVGTIYERKDAESNGDDVATDWTPAATPTPNQDNENDIDNDNALPVQLTSFAATTLTSNDEGTFVQLEWIVESESNISGYNVYRNNTDQVEDIYQINSEIIIAENEASQHSYSYNDTEVELAETFYYWLESVSIDGISKFFGPVEITIEEVDGPDTPEVQLVTTMKSIYPNPFNPTTQVSFTMKEEEDVRVSVYNIKGELISVLHDGLKPKGENIVVWDGRDNNGNACSSGIYFFRMNTKGYTAVRKAALLK